MNTQTKYSMEYCEEICIHKLIDNNESFVDMKCFRRAYLVCKTCQMKEISGYNRTNWNTYVKEFCKQISDSTIWGIFKFMDVPCLLEYHLERLLSEGILYKMYGNRDSLSVKRSYNNDLTKDKSLYESLRELSLKTNFTIEDNQKILDICKHFNERNGSVFLKSYTKMKECYKGFSNDKVSKDEWLDLYARFGVVDENTPEDKLREILSANDITDSSKRCSNIGTMSCIECSNILVWLASTDVIEAIVRDSKKKHPFADPPHESRCSQCGCSPCQCKPEWKEEKYCEYCGAIVKHCQKQGAFNKCRCTRATTGNKKYCKYCGCKNNSCKCTKAKSTKQCNHSNDGSEDECLIRQNAKKNPFDCNQYNTCDASSIAYDYPKEASSKLRNLKFPDIMKLAEKHINMRKMNISIPYSNLEIDCAYPDETLWGAVKGLQNGEKILLEQIDLPANNCNRYGFKRFTLSTLRKNVLRVDDSSATPSVRRKASTALPIAVYPGSEESSD